MPHRQPNSRVLAVAAEPFEPLAMRDAADPVRLGVSGAGFVAQAVHLPLLRELADRFRLVALAEPSRRVREAIAARYGFARAFASVEALLDAGGVDALLVCSPNGAHAATTLAALEAGLHVLVEKPLCLVPADATRIAAAARAASRVVHVGTMKRFDPAYERLLEELAPGEPIDHIATLTYDPSLPRSFAPADAVAADDLPRGADTATADQVEAVAGTRDPRAVRAYSDVFLGALIHDVNLVHGILERAGLEPGGVVDAAVGGGGSPFATGAVALPGGRRWTLGWMLLDGLGDFRERIELLGAGGVRSLEFAAPYLRGAPTRYRHIRPAGHGWTATAAGAWEEPYLRQLLAFHASITAGAPCRTPAEQAARDIALLSDLFVRARERTTEPVA